MLSNSPPLAGLRVLDFTRVLAGPYLTEMLASLGAEVIKIEPPPDGDSTRNQGAPNALGVSYYFHGCNQGKKSVVLDLKSDSGREVALALCAKADVVIDNFRAGVMERIGLSAEALKRTNPAILHVSISAFGADADENDREQPSFDLCTQARGGTMSLNGQRGTAPARLAIPMGDLAGSFYGAIALLACLLRREKAHANAAGHDTTHKTAAAGEFLDISLLDAQVALLGNWVPLAVLSGESPGCIGSAHRSAAPYDVYEASDRPFVVAVFTEKFWLPFLRAAALDALAADVRFNNSNARVANRDALDHILRPHFRKDSRAKWLDRLRAAGVPAEPVSSILEAIRDPAYARRGMIQFDDADGEPARIPRMAFPVKFNGEVHYPSTAPSNLGGDTDACLQSWLGLSRSDVEFRRSSGAFGRSRID
ncbi:MAG: CoA transferase [Planctomycetes bacterium]|nr:CoA transferase [Planctomycetota bacterium]